MYNSQSFCNFQKIKNLEIDLSIHKSANLDYNSTTIHEKIISEDLKNELYNFRKLSKNEITSDNLKKLIGHVILYQFQDSSCYSQIYHMNFMLVKSINIEEDNIYLSLERLYDDSEKYVDGKLISYKSIYKENINYLLYSYDSFGIWISTYFYLDIFQKYNGIKIKNDIRFLEYTLSPKNIKNSQLGDTFFDSNLYNSSKDFNLE
tara:strand:+ start:2569 stop:3183 length:615 start_codon:yes stop_codon:yes gene_type:complete